MARLDQTVGTADYNDIIAAATPTAHIATIKVTESQGVLKRGTVVSGAPGGEMAVVAAALATTASGADSAVTVSSPTVYIIADEVDTGTTDAVTAHAYKTGYFRREALIVGSSYALTDADCDYMRRCGLLTTDSL